MLFLILYIVLRIIRRGTQLPYRLAEKKQRKRLDYSMDCTYKGLHALLQENHEHAEKWLLKGAKYSQSPKVNYLFAAKAAHHQNSSKRRDKHIDRVLSTKGLADASDSDLLASSVLKAKCHFENKEYEEVLGCLQSLEHLKGEKQYADFLLMQTYIALKDYRSLETLLPRLKKNRFIDSKQLIIIQKECKTMGVNQLIESDQTKD